MGNGENARKRDWAKPASSRARARSAGPRAARLAEYRADGRLSGWCLTQSRAEHASHQGFVDPITRQLDAFHGFGDGEAPELGCRD